MSETLASEFGSYEGPGLDRTPPYATDGVNALTIWGKRRSQALNERRKYEPIWAICEHFLAGRQWVAWDPGTRNRIISEPNPSRRERHTVNVITSRFATVLGKLFVEDLRPTIVFTRDDEESESVSTHTRSVAKYLWDTEVAGDKKVHDMLTRLLTYGTAGLRCYFDTTKGEEIGMFPVGPDGQPILDPATARAYVLQMDQMGQQVQFVPLREGKICWEPLSPRNLLVPPGVISEEDFPWVIMERAMPLSWARMKYAQAAGRLNEQELRTNESMGVSIDQGDMNVAPAEAGRLQGHVLISTGYELPTSEYPNGRVITWNEEAQVILEVRDSLPYKLRSEPHHGIVFFHYHRLPHRFWGRGVVEDLIGPQRQKNRARSQMIEMKDRNLGRVYAKKGTITAQNKPVGKIMELIEIPLHADFPQETTGTPPGPWIENEARINDEDMDRVSGMGEVSMGQMPSGSAAYSALALMAQEDDRRVGPMLKMIRFGIGDTMVISLELARRYWQEGKQMAIAGPEGQMELAMFHRTQLPLEFHVDVSRHSPLPTSPAVEAQKIFDIFHAATSAGQPLPIEWLKSSLDQGRALPIPRSQDQVQMSKAQLENVLMTQGQLVMPDYYDDDYMHILMHRQAQVEAMANPELAQFIEMHIQMHAQNMQMKRPSTAGGEVPQMQGGHGIEAQNGQSVNAQGAAQTMAGDAPLQQPA